MSDRIYGITDKVTQQQLRPDYRPGEKYKARRKEELDQMSIDSLARINTKYGKLSPVPLRIVVGSNLQVHT